MANIDLGKVGLTHGGNWNSQASYERLTFVLNPSDGCGYIALRDNIDVTPGSDPTTWGKATESGKSIYELCVQHGTFAGTEDEFVSQYVAAVAAAEDAAIAANSAAANAEAAEAKIGQAEAARSEAEAARDAAEQERSTAETSRENAEDAREIQETARQAASATAIQECNAAKQLADAAAELAKAAAELADTKAGLAAEKAALAAEKAAEAAAAAANLVDPLLVLAEHIASIEENIDVLQKNQAVFGQLTGETIDVKNIPLICGSPLVIVQSGAPSVAPDFAGQLLVDTAGAKAYIAFGYTSVSNWKALN